MRFFFLTLSFLFFACTANAQDKKTELVPLKRMSAYSWAGQNGLLPNNITSAIQSKSGYLWLTTYNGIIRFDGFNAVLYNKNKLPFLKAEGFRNVYQAPDSTLYFASQGSGIVVYKNKTFKPLTVSQGEVPQSVRSLIIGENNDLWIGSVNEGLFKVSGDQIKPIHPEKLSSSTVLDLLKDGEDNIWIATEGEGLYILGINGELDHYTTDNGLQSNVTNCLTKLGGKIFVGTQSGINYFENGKLKVLDFMNDQSINVILPDHDKIWVGSYNGLGRMNFKTRDKEFIDSHEASPLTRINALCFDQEGSLWISTGRDGLIQMRETGITNYTTFDGLSTNKVNIITEGYDNAGHYIGCDDGNIFYLNGEEIKPVNINKNRQSGKTGIRDILETKPGELWVATYHGVTKVTGAIEKHYGLREGLPSTDVRRILKDHNGNIWLGSRSGGATLLVNGQVNRVFDKAHGLESNFILSIEEDALGNIYLGTHSGGLSIITADYKAHNYAITKDDAGVIIFNTHIGKNGNIWIVSNIGLFLFNNGTFQALNLANDYIGTSMFDWLEDDQGNAWITSNQGIIVIERNELDRFLKNPNVLLSSRLINNTDGMVDKECTSAVRSLKASDGKLWVPTIKGVAVISPSMIKENTVKPKVYINYLNADTTTYQYTQAEIPPGKVRYGIHFTALSFVSPAKMKIKYKLDGFDKEYEETSNVRQVEYTNLEPGKYTFHVTAANKDGVWNTQGASFSFIVMPFFYQTIWFYLFIVLISGLALYAIYKWRVHDIEKMNLKLLKVNGELDSFVYSASHDLRSPLASLLGLIDLSKADNENIDIYLGKMQTSVLKLDAFISDIIDFSSNDRKEIEVSTIDLQALVHQVLTELEYIEHQDKIKVNVIVEDKGGFRSDKRRVAIILRNLISNAFKYIDLEKDVPTVDIFVEGSAKFASIEIKDNGIGIDKKDTKNIYKMFYRASELSSGSGLGLYIVKETVEKLSGAISLDSAKGKGSTFSVYLRTLRKT